MVVWHNSLEQGLWTWTAQIGMNPYLVSCVTLGKLVNLSRSLLPLL